MRKLLVNEADFQSLAKSIFKDLKANEFLTIGLAGEASQFIRFNGGKIRQSGNVSETNLNFDFYLKSSEGLRKTSAAICLTGDPKEDLRRANESLTSLREIVKNLPIDPFAEVLEGLESSRESIKGKILDESEAAEAVLQPLQGADAAGLYAGGGIQRAMASSTGLLHWFETDTFVLDYSLYTREQRALKRTFAGSDWNQKKFEAQAEEARESLTALSQNLVRPKVGRHRVYISPAAVNDWIQMLSWGCIGENSIRTGESPLLKLRKGDQQLSNKFSLSEDFKLGVNCRFNSEGELAPSELKLIDRGQLKQSLVGRRSSKEYSCASTGANASESLRSPAMATGDLSESEILKTLGDGLYLSNLHYLNWSDQPNGRVTGLTRFACFEVKNGRLAAPLETMRFDESIFSVFGTDLERVTQEASVAIETGTYEMRSLGGAKVPGLLLKEFSIVG